MESNFSMIDIPTNPRQTSDVYLLRGQNGRRIWNKYSLLHFGPLPHFYQLIFKRTLCELEPKGEIASKIVHCGN